MITEVSQHRASFDTRSRFYSLTILFQVLSSMGLDDGTHRVETTRKEYDEWRRVPLPQSSFDFDSRPPQFRSSRPTESLEQAILWQFVGPLLVLCSNFASNDTIMACGFTLIDHVWALHIDNSFTRDFLIACCCWWAFIATYLRSLFRWSFWCSPKDNQSKRRKCLTNFFLRFFSSHDRRPKSSCWPKSRFYRQTASSSKLLSPRSKLEVLQTGVTEDDLRETMRGERGKL